MTESPSATAPAYGWSPPGQREILGLDVGDSEDEVFWKGFMTSLKQRGPGGRARSSSTST